MNICLATIAQFRQRTYTESFPAWTASLIIAAKLDPADIPIPMASAPWPNARAAIAMAVNTAARIPDMIAPAVAESYALWAASKAALFDSMDLLI